MTSPQRTQVAQKTQPDWWRQAVVYQIYPRSFADANGDGVGDLPGIISRVPYLVALGIDAVWLSPFYPSALADGGYDVDDYRNVDPRLGTLDDFDQLIEALHAEGIKLIVDIVPNHTSDRHEWFVEALEAAKGEPPGSGTSSATAPTAPPTSRRRTGTRCSAAPPGPRPTTASGICTCSPPSSPT